MIFIPIALLLIFIPVVYALGCSIKKTVRIERVVPASVERLHKLMKKREKLLEFNKYIETEELAEENDGEEKTLLVCRTPLPLFSYRKGFELMKFIRYIDIPQNESVDITMTPIGTFELFLRLEQAYTYERVSENETKLFDEVSVTTPRLAMGYVLGHVKMSEEAVMNSIVQHFEERNKAKQLRKQNGEAKAASATVPSEF